jgi:hypothetical protein
MLLLFEFDPGEELALQVTGQPRIRWVTDTGQTTYSWIAAEGVWDDGEEIAHVGRNFHELPTNTAQEYGVTITSSGLSIELESQESKQARRCRHSRGDSSGHGRLVNSANALTQKRV